MMTYVEKNRGIITAHKLMLFESCQFCYFMKYILEVEDPTEDKECFLIGLALDDLTTYGPEEYAKKYQVVSKRGTAKALADGRIELTKAIAKKVEKMYQEFRLNMLFEQQPMKKLLRINYGGFDLGAELDDYARGMIRDIKSAKSVELLEDTRKDIFKQYLFQMSFYCFLAELVLDDKPTARLQIVDKYTYFPRSLAVDFSYSTMHSEYARIINLLEELKEAEASKFWPATTNQKVLWKCPYYGFKEPNGKRHGCPDKPLTY